MSEDSKLTKSDTPDPEIGSILLFRWLGEEISKYRRRAEEATAIADRLASLMAEACDKGQWREVRKVNLETDRAYVIRRPGTRQMELASWNNGWRTIMGHIASGGELEVWEPSISQPENLMTEASPPPVECALLPCPFCGEEGVPGMQIGAWHGQRREYAVVRCRSPKCAMRPETPSVIAGVCSSQQDQWPTQAQAVAAWNCRRIISKATNKENPPKQVQSGSESANCPECGKRVRTCVPAGGDGSAVVFIRHRDKSGNRCDGSRCMVDDHG